MRGNDGGSKPRDRLVEGRKLQMSSLEMAELLRYWLLDKGHLKVRKYCCCFLLSESWYSPSFKV